MGGARLKLEKPDGMFVFSKFMEKKEELSGWVRWFENKGIKTQILWCSFGYYLCREGVEAI